MLISLNEQHYPAGIKLHFANPSSRFRVGLYVRKYPVYLPRYNRTELCIDGGQGGFVETLDLPFDRLGFLYHAPGDNRIPSTAKILKLYEDNGWAKEAVLIYVCNSDVWSELHIKIYDGNPPRGCEEQVRSIYCGRSGYRAHGRTAL